MGQREVLTVHAFSVLSCYTRCVVKAAQLTSKMCLKPRWLLKPFMSGDKIVQYTSFLVCLQVTIDKKKKKNFPGTRMYKQLQHHLLP